MEKGGVMLVKEALEALYEVAFAHRPKLSEFCPAFSYVVSTTYEVHTTVTLILLWRKWK